MISICTMIYLQEGQTAVHLAAASGHVEVLDKLLLYGVEVHDRDSVSAETMTFHNYDTSL